MQIHHRLASLVTGLVFAALLSACASSGMREPAHRHTLVFLKNGEKAGQLSATESSQMFAGHMANIQKLAKEGKLLVAGPFGKPRTDSTLRGVFVFATDDVAEAQAMGDQDPGVKAGEFRADVHPFATDSRLATALERAMAAEEKAKSEGKAANPAAFIRPYVLLTLERAADVWSDLEGMVERGQVCLLGRLDESRGLAVIVAKDRTEAEAILAPIATRLGTYTLEPWFATGELVGMDRDTH